MKSSPTKFRFNRSLRLSLDREFQAVFHCKVRTGAGPLLVYGRPNQRAHARIGLSVNRRVGSAVRRNRMKRLLREAFRLMQHELPAYDVILVVRPHSPILTVAAYQRHIANAMRKLEQKWNQPPQTDRPDAASSRQD